MKNIVLVLFLLVSMSYAQHCPFDNKGLLVVKVEIKNSDKHYLFLQPVLTYTNKNNESIRTEFHQNKQTTNDYLRKLNNYNVSALRFDFAKNYFVVDIPMDDLKNTTIHLEDENENIVGEKYAVKQEDKFDLHANYKNTWQKFSSDFTPKPLNEFNSLIVLRTNTIEKVKSILYKEKGNNLHFKIQRGDCFIRSQTELDSLVITSHKIDFSKKLVFYQQYYGDCHFKVSVFKFSNEKENSTTIKSFHKYGGCRAMGRKEMILYIDKPAKNTKLLFEELEFSDYKYLNDSYW